MCGRLSSPAVAIYLYLYIDQSIYIFMYFMPIHMCGRLHLTSDGDISRAKRSSCSPDIIRNPIKPGRGHTYPYIDLSIYLSIYLFK